PLQRRRLVLFVVERELKELIERVGRLGSQPCKKLAPAAFCSEEPSKEGERRPLARSARTGVEPGNCVGETRIVLRFLAQCAAQRATAIPCQLEQHPFIESEQWALQGNRKRQVVLRQQQRVGECHEVDDADMLSQD